MDDSVKNTLSQEYLKGGENYLSKKLLVSAIKQISLLIEQGSNSKNFPDTELLNISQNFLQLYREEGDDHYLEISKICRKVAHRVYRVLLKKHLVKKNNKFLNLV
jgi:hypothetical protein